MSGAPAALIGAPPSTSMRSTVQDVSADGRFVLVRSTVTHPAGRLYVHDRLSGSTTEVPLVLAVGRAAPATISDDGQRIGLAVDRTVEGPQQPVAALHNRVTGATTVMTADSTTASALWLDQSLQISADGRRVVFTIVGPEGDGPRIVRADFPS